MKRDIFTRRFHSISKGAFDAKPKRTGIKIPIALFFLCLLLPFTHTVFGQARICGFDAAMTREYQQYPWMAQNVKNADSLWNVFKNSSARVTINHGDTVFEIPVVVHIMTTGGAIGSHYNPADSVIEKWINYLSEVYAGTYQAYPHPGHGGVAMPVKFVLAKRDPDCQPTNGITRTDLSSNSAYVNYGLNSSGNNGLSATQLKNIVQWPTNAYYNMYVVNKIDGEDGYTTTTAFVAGFAYLGLSQNIPNDGAYMLAYISNAGESTLPHEIGHALGLYHTFQGSHNNICPPNNNCHQDGDKVCDTDPGISLLGSCPDSTDINSCTNTAYGANGVQHNIMNYSRCPNHFTPGQAERMMFMLQEYRSDLIHSMGAVAPDTNIASPVSACVPNTLNHQFNNFNVGPCNVNLDSIDYQSTGYDGHLDNYYIDHTQSCLFQTHTSLVATDTYTLSVSTVTNRQNIKAYIDYNNDGIFQASELVMNVSNNPINQTATATIVPPNSAVKNIPLRMRVIADYYTNNNITPCSTLDYGQTEDFSVTILPPPGQCSAGLIDTNHISNICSGFPFSLRDTSASTGNGVSYQWQKRVPAGNGIWVNIPSNNSRTLFLPNGINDTTDFRLLVHCRQSQLEDTTPLVTIHPDSSLCTCLPPVVTSIQTDFVGIDSATISWQPPLQPDTNRGYDVYWSDSNAWPSSPSAHTVDTFIKIGGLLPHTQYYFWVRTDCTDLTNSLWSQMFRFKTACDGPVVNLGSDTSICSGTKGLILDVGAQPPTYSINWNTGEHTQSIIVNQTGEYFATVDAHNGCMTRDSIRVTVITQPTVNAISALSNGFGAYNFEAWGVQNAQAYHWDFGDGHISSDSTPVHTYSRNINYQVILTITNACGEDTTSIIIHGKPEGIGADVTLNKKLLKLYPNPATSKITIDNKSHFEMTSVTVYNVLGQKVFQGKVHNTDYYQLDTHAYASGVYNVKVGFDNGKWVMGKFEIRQ